MENLIRYLRNPIQTGVHYNKFTIDFAVIDRLLRDMVAIEERKKLSIDSEELADAIAKMKTKGALTLSEMKQTLNMALTHFLAFGECPKEIVGYMLGKKWGKALEKGDPGNSSLQFLEGV